jgi:hypothetical protein
MISLVLFFRKPSVTDGSKDNISDVGGAKETTPSAKGGYTSMGFTMLNSTKVIPCIFPLSILGSHLTLMEQDIRIGLTK